MLKLIVIIYKRQLFFQFIPLIIYQLANDLNQALKNILNKQIKSFKESQIFFKDNNPNSQIELKLSKEFENIGFDAQWGCSLTYSNIPLKNLIFIISALLQEYSIVLVSPNITLLTSTIVTLLAAIKPFQWPFSTIMNVPTILFDLIDSPVPIFIGLNKSKQFVVQHNLQLKNPQCIFVFLSEPKVHGFMFQDLKDQVILPDFGKYKSSINNCYDKLFVKNQKRKKRYRKLSDILENELVDKANITNSIYQQQQNNRKLIYVPTNEHLDNCQKIFKCFYEFLNEEIILKIPERPSYIYKLSKIDTNKFIKRLDYDAIKNSILTSSNNYNKDFVNKILNTQMFAQYLDEFYLQQH